MHRIVKRDRLWLYSMDSYLFARSQALIPYYVTPVVVSDAFLLALDIKAYPNTSEGIVKLFLAWSEGSYIYSPSKGKTFVYEVIGSDPNLGTYGGQWRESIGFSSSVQDWDCSACMEECWNEIQDGIAELMDKSKNFSQIQQKTAKELSDIAAQRKPHFTNLTSDVFLKYVKANACWDANFYQKGNGSLINCRNGVYDLENMTFRSSQRTDYMDYVLPVSYNPHADDPNLWMLLDHIFGNDEDKLEFTLGVLSTLLDRNLSPKPILIFYHKQPSQLCMYLRTFLRCCLAPFLWIGTDKQHTSTQYWRPCEPTALSQDEMPPRIQYFNDAQKRISDAGWKTGFQMGLADQPHQYTKNKTTFSVDGTILIVVETNQIPHFNFDIPHPGYIIPMDATEVGKPQLNHLFLYNQISETTKSMMLNLLIEAYQRWTEKSIQIPTEIKKLSKACSW